MKTGFKTIEGKKGPVRRGLTWLGGRDKTNPIFFFFYIKHVYLLEKAM
jgi:hypothetical protein